MKQEREFALHIFILCSIAFAQPLYVLSTYAEIFVAHRAKPIDIILFLFIPSLAVPFFFVLIEFLSGIISQRARRIVHHIIVAGLFGVVTIIVLKKFNLRLPGNVILTSAVLLGVLITMVYLRFQDVRKLVTIFFPVILIFPYLFLFDSPVRKIVLPDEELSSGAVKIEKPVPVVMVVFDEFPLTSLLDENHLIDPARHPNFASLAQNAYWFRNATTVSDHTHIAVPAILTGNYPEQNRLPIITDYPQNLFTLLGRDCEMKVYECMTQLCPERLCGEDAMPSIKRISLLFADISVVSLHIILPMDLASWLPDVTTSWKDFEGSDNSAFIKGIYGLVETAKKEMSKDRGEIFREFLETINSADSDKLVLYFHHSYLPHTPWNYLPSGKRYSLTGHEIKGLKLEQWGDNESFVTEAYQRHLLQVGYVDKLVGELLERLKSVGMYDRSLIIITADHGVSFQPNDSRRYVGKTNYQDIMPVPLFIKLPDQTEGIISDKNVETIDIVPTIADVLKIALPQPLDGRSVFDASLPEKEKKTIFAKQTAEEKLIFEPVLNKKYETLERQLALFGSGKNRNVILKAGSYNGLLNRHVNEIGIVGKAEMRVQFDQASYFDNVDLNAFFIPAHITGRVLYKAEAPAPLHLAIAVNGVISEVSETYRNERDEMGFSAIVPEAAFRKGSNEVAAFLVEQKSGKIMLSRTQSEAFESYTLDPSGYIIPSGGTAIPITSDPLIGFLDFADMQGDNLLFSGWAANVKELHPADAIVIFANGKFLYSGYCNFERPDLVEAYKNPDMFAAGFKYNIPLSLIGNINNSEMRLFAISKQGLASELNYPKEYKWRKGL